jgi:hypothetical protein
VPLLNDADNIQYGAAQVDAAYLGTNLVWVPVIRASGGSVEEVNIGGIIYKIHTFTSNDEFVVNGVGLDPTVEYVIVGGGGGGGRSRQTEPGGGGGAGGYRSSVIGELSGRNSVAETKFSVTKTTYPVVVGAGGASTAPGENSSVFGITSLGGGNGGRGRDSGGENGAAGGSGGGAGSDEFSVRSGGAGTAGQGFNGGSSPNANLENSGGGGGAGGAGANGGGTKGTIAAGGAGLTTNITGSPLLLAKGAQSHSGGAGAANTGNGGSGVRTIPDTPGSPGGSGIVIIRYPIG